MADLNIPLDNELADLTDAKLEGRAAMTESADAKSLESIIDQLRQMNASTEGPSTEYRARLTKAVNDEWNAVQSQRNRQRSSRRLISRSMSPYVALAAVLVVVLVIAALFSNSGVTKGITVPDGPIDPSFFAVMGGLVVIALVIAVVLFWRGRK